MNSIQNAFIKTLSRSLGTKFFLAVAVLAFSACKKESNIGLDVQPDSDLLDLQYMDTLSLKTCTVEEDSLRTDESPTVQIGYLNDPIFGIAEAGLFTQFSIPNSLQNIDFGNGAVLDSCVFTLRYDFDFVGDTTQPMTFDLYQMTEDLHKDSSYYSNHLKQVYSFPVGTTGSFMPHPRLGAATATDTLPAYLRFGIDSNFAQQIFAQSGTANLANNEAFQAYFKGFYVKSQVPSSTGALLRFTPQDSLTKLTFYYHTGSDTTTFDFVINSGTAYYSYFRHDHSGATSSLVNQLNNPGTASSDYVYIQGASGLKTKIEFPTLSYFQSMGDVIINKAELIIKADPTQATGNLPLNTQLYLAYLDSAGNQYLLPDMVETSSYYGGSLNTTTNEYHINLARHFQRLVDGDEGNYGLYLKELKPVEYGRRAVLGGANYNTNYRMYLHIVYTRIN